jgi:tetratricopeptide (TPR) repeat protein
MGAFFDSIHVRSDNAGMLLLQKALEQIAREEDLKFLMGPALNGWTCVFPSEIGVKEPISARIAALVPDDIFQLMVHDDDVFFYWFYRDGRLVDRYNSNPDYFEAATEDELKEAMGRPELFKDLLPEAKSLSKLKKLLTADRFTFESERMRDFVELLGLSNALTSYDYLQEKEIDEIEGWNQFIHIGYQPVTANDYNSRGEAKLAKNDIDGALADFNKALELNPDSTEARENQIKANHALNDRNKEWANGYTFLGQEFKEKGELDNALTYFNKAIECDPTFAVAYSSRGMVKKSKGDLEGAMADFNKAIELKENLPVTYMSRAAIKKAKGDLAGALVDYNRCIELKPGSAKAFNNRGELKFKQGDRDGALEDYNRAIELKPDNAIYYSNRSMVKIKRDPDGAIVDCNRAIELKPDLGTAYNNRGMAKQVKGDLDGALEDYNKAISLQPDIAEFQINRDKALKIKNEGKQ